MTSILTNMSAMSAVTNLTATQKNLADVQNEISTGLKVSSAKDNAAYYSIATTMRTQVSNLSAVTDSLNLGTSVIGTATSALSTMTSVLQKMQADLVTAQQPGTDLNAIGTDIKALQSQLQSSVQSASFNGINLLDGSQTTTADGGNNATATTSNVGFVSSVTGAGATTAVNYINLDSTGTNFSTDAASTKSLFTTTVAAVAASGTSPGVTGGTIDVSGTGTGGGTAMVVTAGTTSQADIAGFIKAVGAAISNVTTASQNLGAAQKNIDLQSTFISSLSDSITTGVGSLVDANMNDASTRLSALQTQQQLGIQALSVANQNSQLILKLFQ